MTADDTLKSVQVLYNENTIIVNNTPIKLRPMEMDYFQVLYERRENVLLYDHLINRVHGLMSSHSKSMQVIIHRINRKLNKYGIKIISIRSRGYKLTSMHKDEISLSNQVIEINGIKKTAKEWCAFYGLNLASLYNYTHTGTTPFDYIYKRGYEKNPTKKLS